MKDKKMIKPTIKELMMALPNKNRLEIWQMLENAKFNFCAYHNDDTISKQYDAIISETLEHVEVDQ